MLRCCDAGNAERGILKTQASPAPAARDSLLFRHPEIRHSGVGQEHVRGGPQPHACHSPA
jgi:hypothetical protein